MNVNQDQAREIAKTKGYSDKTIDDEIQKRSIDIDESKQEIITEYYGPDLLTNYQAGTLLKDIPDIIEQVIEMFKFFKEHNVYKFNNALSNMTVNNKQLVAFDFKWARERPEGKEHELFSYTEWMSKIDDKLPEMLEKLA